MKHCAWLALVVACGCQGRTEIIVGVATDLRAKNQIDHVDLTALRNGKPTIHQPWNLADVPAGLYELPGSFGLYSPDGSEPTIELQVLGSRGGPLVVERTSIVSLISGKTLFLRLGLVGDCDLTDGPSCPTGSSCIEGVCRANEVDPQRLPAYRRELVDHVACVSGTNFVVSSTGIPMPALATDCAADEFCQEGTCLKRLAQDPPEPSTTPDWVDTSTPSPAPLRALSGSESSGDIYAVGEGGVVLHGMGGASDPSWVSEASGVTSSLFGVWVAGPDDVFACGSAGVVLHRHGGIWSVEALGGILGIERLDAIWGVSLDDFWAVGRLPGNVPVALHRLAGVWTVDGSLVGPTGLHAIWGAAANDLYAVGDSSHVQHFDGSVWKQISVEPGHDFIGVGGSAGGVFLVGRGGLIARASLSGVTLESGPLDGKQAPFATDLFAVWAAGPKAIYAVGDYGKILFSTGAADWVEQVSGTDAALFAVFGLRGHIYAAGRLGKILRSDGLTPAAPDLGTPECSVDDECATSCGGFMLLSRICQAGHCVDGAQAACNGGFVCAADGVACKVACTDDDDCQASAYCEPGGTCRARNAQGAACNVDSGGDCKTAGCRECADGFFCTDHVCCDQSPAQCGGCSQCSAPTGTGGPVVAGTDPHGSCTARTAECTQTTCNGRGTCNNTGNPCGTNMCAAGELTQSSCADGVCSALPAVPCANSSPCADAMTCAGKCTDDTGCPTGYYCDIGGDCAAQKNKGGACNTTAVAPGHCKTAGCRECATATQCVDGYCCDAACGGECQACDVATKEGTCSPVASGAPHGSRTACITTPATCAGACAGKANNAASQASCTYPTGACGTDSCSSASLTQHACMGGACSAKAPTACTTGYLCASGTSCAGPACASDAQCDTANDYYCNKSSLTCVQSTAPGGICNVSTQCASGTCHLCKGTDVCAFGVCCANACAGQCQQCNSSGQCVLTTSGQPVQGRSTCSSDGSNCSTCNGSGTGCANLSTATICGGPACSAANASQVATCNGAGACGAPVTTQCGPSGYQGRYACEGSGTCETACASSTDCAPNYFCNTTQRYCGLANGKACGTAMDCQSAFCTASVCCDQRCTLGTSGDACANYDAATGEYHGFGRLNGCTTGTCTFSASFACTAGYLCVPAVGSCSSSCQCDNPKDTNTTCASSSCDSAGGYNCLRDASKCLVRPIG